MGILHFESVTFAGNYEVGLVLGFGRIGVAIEDEIGRLAVGSHVGEEEQTGAKDIILAADGVDLRRYDLDAGIADPGEAQLARQVGDVPGVEVDVGFDRLGSSR